MCTEHMLSFFRVYSIRVHCEAVRGVIQSLVYSCKRIIYKAIEIDLTTSPSFLKLYLPNVSECH